MHKEPVDTHHQCMRPSVQPRAAPSALRDTQLHHARGDRYSQALQAAFKVFFPCRVLDVSRDLLYFLSVLLYSIPYCYILFVHPLYHFIGYFSTAYLSCHSPDIIIFLSAMEIEHAYVFGTARTLTILRNYSTPVVYQSRS